VSFSLLWQERDDAWRMYRIVSFDHHPLRAAPLPATARNVPAAVLRRYAGHYRSPESGAIEVTLAGTQLMLRSGGLEILLVAIGAATFSAGGRGLDFEFVMENGKAARLRVIGHGATVTVAERQDQGASPIAGQEQVCGLVRRDLHKARRE